MSTEDTCPKCGTGITRQNSTFTYYGCLSYKGEEFHQSAHCKRNCDPLHSRGPYDKSPCCDAPIDASHVIQTGRYAGHGTYYCSKCGRVAYIV